MEILSLVQADFARKKKKGGQVTKQMFIVFLRKICSLLTFEWGPTITEAIFNKAAVERAR